MIRKIASISLVTAVLAASAIACDKPGVTEQQKETKANDQAEQARVEADKKVAAARVDFQKTREDYRHQRFIDLSDLDKNIFDLQADDRTATGKTKMDLDAHLPGILAQRETFARDLEALDTTSSSSWDAAKANVDHEWDALKAAVSKAK